MNEHTVELTTPLGPVTAEFSKGRLTGADVASVRTGRGFGINCREYFGRGLPDQPRLDRGRSSLAVRHDVR